MLTHQQATDLGTLGYVAKASGVPTDARSQHPFLDLGQVLAVRTHTGGDVLSRFLIRAEEITNSVALITHLTHHNSDTDTDTDTKPEPTASGPASGVGIVEGWRGTITHRVELDTDGTLTRVKIVDPSFFNWPALPVALTDTIGPDFPLTNKSFNLSYAGNDL